MKTEGPAGTTSSARSEILRRIRSSTGGSLDAAVVQSEWGSVARDYRRAFALERAKLVELMKDRLEDYDARVEVVASSAVAGTVARMLTERAKRSMLLPRGIATDWLPPGFEFVVDDGGEADRLNDFDGVLTGATVAIAQTGTLVLQNAAGQGRRALTLVPDYHLCIVDVANIVETVPEAINLLRRTATLPTTFVSGPSATADIEMTRIKGVHGPRDLDVILIV